VKLLVFSHPCVTAVNQSFYSDLEQHTGWTVTLVMPNRWTTEYGPIDGCARWPAFKGSINCHPVFFPGDIPRHVYRSFLVNLLRRERPDAIYMHHEPYGFATYQVYFANQITGQRPIGFYAAQNLLKNYPPPIRQLEGWVFRRSSYAFPVTSVALDVLRKKHYNGSAEVLPLAVSSDLYKPTPIWGSERRREMGILPGRVVFGYMGRLVEEKGLRTLFSALELLGDLDWELLLVGGGPLEGELRERASGMGKTGNSIRFLGYVPHVEAPNWLSLFDVMVLPSETRSNWMEQFGRVLVEAMACGTPVLGSDSGEIPKIIKATGGGLVFPEGDVSSLAEVMLQLARSAELRSNLARAGREAVLTSYDQVHLSRRFAAVIEAALGKVQS
jgi:glycosyltransferase involved in cell wall biosynthesis